MPQVKFVQDYNHTWPNRAQTAFKAGWEGNVKAEVADAAIALGRAKKAPKLAAPIPIEPPADSA